MWIVILGLGLGLAIGFFTPVSIPVALSKYLAVALLAGLDSSLGGIRAGLERHFRLSIFTSGFTFNILIAAVLVYLGDLLGIDLYLAAIVVFGMRIFNNITAIRRNLIDKYWILPKEAALKAAALKKNQDFKENKEIVNEQLKGQI
jgi:small basic protein